MIICCGEALIDMIPETGPDDEPRFASHPGGAIFNTAIALGRLGIKVGFLSGISTDLFGQMLRDALHDSAVYTDQVQWSDRPTTLAFVELTDGQAQYTFYDENTAGRMLEPDALPSIPDGCTAMYFGGISLIGEPAADFYLALALREASKRLIILDPNIRPGFIRDEGAYRARLDKMLSHADVLKVSDEDLAWMIPGAQTVDQKVQLLQRQGPRIVVVTRGADGASAYLGHEQPIMIVGRKVKVVDTVGAGDTFNAGFLAHLSEHGYLDRPGLRRLGPQALADALAFAAEVAAVTVSRAGADPPWADELQAL